MYAPGSGAVEMMSLRIRTITVIEESTFMKKHVVSGIALAFLVGLSGCKDDLTKQMEGFKDEMCACKDKACAEKVAEKMGKWATENAEKVGKDTKPTPEQEKLGTEMTQCMTKAMGG